MPQPDAEQVKDFAAMQQAHIGNAVFAGMPPLFAPPTASISCCEETNGLPSAFHTSLLDLAERKLGLFFGTARHPWPSQRPSRGGDAVYLPGDWM